MKRVDHDGGLAALGIAAAACFPGSVPAVRDVVAARNAELDGFADRADIRAFLGGQRTLHADLLPDSMQELDGLAAGFGMPVDALFLFLHGTILREMRGRQPAGAEDGCSVWAARTAAGPMLVKNRDFHVAHAGLQAATVFRGPETATPVVGLGSLGAPLGWSSGMSRDLAVADTQIAARSHGPGLNRYLLIGHLLRRCASVDDALAVIRRVPHVGGGSLTLADRGGALATVELGHRAVGVARGDAAGHSTETNHFVSEACGSDWLPGDDAANRSTEARLRRLRDTVPLLAGLPEADIVPEAKALMASHASGDGHDALCRHEAEARGQDTLSCAIYDLGAGVLHVADGHPCAGRWTTVTAG